MRKPQLMFFVSEKLYAIFPTIENGIVPLKDNRRGILAMSCEHNGSYTVALHTVSRIIDEQYETEQLLEVFRFSNFQDKEWFSQYLAYMSSSRILMHINRKHHSQRLTSRITSTNESEVERAKKFLGLSQTKTEVGLVIALRTPEEEWEKPYDYFLK
ncbi:hypothetical protein [Bacillus sp. OTU530]|uniref:hypothetical protein n=1 Tax=Bacillus sp. OTU530 TaxID=3043862 RepID=UPI00313DE13D